MSDKKHWITKLVPTLAFAAGIIIASVGGIMTMSSSLKLAFFESHSYSYVRSDDCRYDYNNQTSKGDAPYERSASEMEKCMIEKKSEELARYQNEKKENIVDGVSALIVGGILLLVFKRRK